MAQTTVDQCVAVEQVQSANIELVCGEQACTPQPFELERVMGIEPTLVAWEATVLPLNYTRAGQEF